MISTLQKLAGFGNEIAHSSSSSVNFNANLPVEIEVLSQLNAFHYRLKIGRKELSTKSKKELSVHKKYWANFDENKGGILTISQMHPQPELFEDAFFTPFELASWINRTTFDYTAFRTFLIETLTQEQCGKELFQSFSYMLHAFSKKIIHLPLILHGKKVLLQFFHNDPNTLSFYLAFENLGPMRGFLTQNELLLELCYEKSLYFLQKEQAKLDMITRFSLQKEIKPLFDRNDVVLDIKG